jgi:phenylpyruvate tautomerase PptA (4-oxalocrotonate tautomerase family)
MQMPTYACSVPPGLLNENQKSDLASAITRNHHEATGAPPYFVQVVIEENATAQRYLGGEPAADQVWIRADIRSGRTVEQRRGLMLAIMRDAARIAGVEESSIWVYLCNLEPTDMVEYGHVLPPPGREKEWFESLPSALQDYLVSLGTKKRDFAL